MPKGSPEKTVLARRIILVLIILLIALAALWVSGREDNQAEKCEPVQLLPETKLTSGDVSFTAEIARTQEEKFKGLSGRRCLDVDRAMLFEYETEGIYCFVMREMRFPIDMVWLDEDKKIIDIKHNARPENYPAETYCPVSPARFVLEFKSGTVESNGWQVGAQFAF